nr:MAG TPA: hypothetical protein [Caudoviricetes sp.]
MNTKVDKPVLIRRQVTHYGKVGDLFTVFLDDDALWDDDRVCQGDFVICTNRDVSSYTREISGLMYKLMVKEHNSKLGKSFILNINERRYLSEVIGPFRDKVKYIMRVKDINLEENYILISFNRASDCITLPNFKRGTKYKGMEEGEKYTLDELGL